MISAYTYTSIQKETTIFFRMAMLSLLPIFIGLLTSHNAVAQFSSDPVTNFAMRQATGTPTIGDQVFSAFNAYGDLVSAGTQSREKISNQLTVARERFWEEYPDGPGLNAARAELANALRAKDEYYLLRNMGSVEGSPGLLGRLLPQELDGGLRLPARGYFSRWVREVWVGIGAGQFEETLRLMGNPNAGNEALAKAQPLYARYAVIRDWEEFRARGLMPPEFNSLSWRIVESNIQKAELEVKSKPLVTPDPYRDAIEYFENLGDVKPFLERCPIELPQIMGSIQPETCSCIDTVLRAELDPDSHLKFELEFSDLMFFATAASKVGLTEKLGTCFND